MACADTANDAAKPAIAINLIILSSLTVQSLRSLTPGNGAALVFEPRKPPAPVARRLEIDQGPADKRRCEKQVV
jgi:hypothetical protein